MPDGLAVAGVGAGGGIHAFTVHSDAVDFLNMYHLYQFKFPLWYSWIPQYLSVCTRKSIVPLNMNRYLLTEGGGGPGLAPPGGLPRTRKIDGTNGTCGFLADFCGFGLYQVGVPPGTFGTVVSIVHPA